MSSKLLVIIATSNKEKALTSLMYPRNAIMHGWLSDIKVIFFDPSEHLMVEDDEVSNEAKKLATMNESIVCKFLSDRDGVSEEIENLGVTVDYIGNMISDLIKDGYVPMAW